MKSAFLLEKAITDPKPEVFLEEIRARSGASKRKGERDEGVAGWHAAPVRSCAENGLETLASLRASTSSIRCWSLTI